MSEPINLVSAADERFALPLAVTLRSVAATCSRPIQAFVLSDDLSEQSKGAVERVCAERFGKMAIHWLDADGRYLRDIPVGLPHLSRATFLRLGIGRLLGPEVRRILYLDSDTLVLKDVAELWETPLDGNVVGAVRDFTTNRSGQPDGLGYCIEEAGLDPAKPLFNAGVLVIDMDAYRTLQIEDQCVAFLRRWRDHIYSADQDALNGVLHRRWKGLHFRWNVQTGLAVFRTINELSAEEREMLRNLDPAILHFSGSSKPWNSGLRSAQCRQYVRCVQATGWHGRAGFRLWQAKRVAACVRSAMMNRLAPAQLGAAANA